MSYKGDAIREHAAIHRLKEPRALHISEYLHEAANLLDAKDEGRLIELPCAVGAPYYFIEKFCSDGNEDGSLTMHWGSDCEYWCDQDSCNAELRVVEFTFKSVVEILEKKDRIGKQYWLNRSEAENELNQTMKR